MISTYAVLSFQSPQANRSTLYGAFLKEYLVGDTWSISTNCFELIEVGQDIECQLIILKQSGERLSAKYQPAADCETACPIFKIRPMVQGGVDSYSESVVVDAQESSSTCSKVRSDQIGIDNRRKVIQHYFAHAFSNY